MRIRSFTLIELLIVLVIIGILATLAIPRYARFVNKVDATNEMARLLKAIAVLKATTGMYPNDMPWYDRPSTDGNIWTLDNWKSPRFGLVDTDGTYPNWSGPYIENNDDNFLDQWGNVYIYDGNPGIAGEMNYPGGVAIASGGPNGEIVVSPRYTGGPSTFNNPSRIPAEDDIAIY